ncbi:MULTISPECIES: energy transducer TonB [unclassified Halanaerobium]|uniref:energy transducer TonB n=1 Tax=unclassified Halanaerobium TaxID=2641197 RepID=UPI000DF3FA13|nr:MULTISPECIES: energy transducer TonB [unclassified Halanaerobium]RCW51503.1 protein TonB [Halanaerobium sp. MA284_MarDTE_T2]RCW89291.1 protein TonB [Halanaerobium sp. DL-01]
MSGNDNQNKLAAYVVFSIILHLLLLYFIPFGFMQGNVRGENTDLNDYGYIQLVEYQPAPLQTEEPVPQEEIEEITAEQEKITEEKEDTEAKEVEEPEEIKKPEPEHEPEIEENIEVESDITEEELSQENTSAEEVKKETEDIKEEITDTETNDSENTETKVLSSEKSDVEVEIEEEQNTAEDSAQSAENIKPGEEEVEQTPPPPPPPTSGELISIVVRPAFPKDLVGSRAEGTVKLTVEITPEGTVKNVTINETSGYDTMDRVAVLTIKRGWSFKSYNKAYVIPIEVKYYIDEFDNSQVDVNLGNVEFLTGGE